MYSHICIVHICTCVYLIYISYVYLCIHIHMYVYEHIYIMYIYICIQIKNYVYKHTSLHPPLHIPLPTPTSLIHSHARASPCFPLPLLHPSNKGPLKKTSPFKKTWPKTQSTHRNKLPYLFLSPPACSTYFTHSNLPPPIPFPRIRMYRTVSPFNVSTLSMNF